MALSDLQFDSIAGLVSRVQGTGSMGSASVGMQAGAASRYEAKSPASDAAGTLRHRLTMQAMGLQALRLHYLTRHPQQQLAPWTWPPLAAAAAAVASAAPRPARAASPVHSAASPVRRGQAGRRKMAYAAPRRRPPPRCCCRH